jgi:MoaA/NifB/PqqE/SkfB family radical SAM enzyme
MKYTWPDEELEVKDVCNALKILKDKYGLKSVFFSGGDPIIYKGVKEVINFCVDNDIKYSLISTLITNDEELLKLIAKTAYRVHVSLDSTDAEIYRIIRGVDGFTVADKNIKFIVANRDKNKIPVRISSTVGIFNYSEIYSLYEYAKENVCLINFYFMQTWDNLKMDEEKEQVFYDELAKIAYDEKCNKKIITNARNLILQQYNFENESEKCKRCYLPNISLVVNANGDLYPCCKLLNEHDFYKNQSENSFGNIISKTG